MESPGVSRYFAGQLFANNMKLGLKEKNYLNEDGLQFYVIQMHLTTSRYVT